MAKILGWNKYSASKISFWQRHSVGKKSVQLPKGPQCALGVPSVLFLRAFTVSKCDHIFAKTKEQMKILKKIGCQPFHQSAMWWWLYISTAINHFLYFSFWYDIEGSTFKSLSRTGFKILKCSRASDVGWQPEVWRGRSTLKDIYWSNVFCVRYVEEYFMQNAM